MKYWYHSHTGDSPDTRTLYQ